MTNSTLGKDLQECLYVVQGSFGPAAGVTLSELGYTYAQHLVQIVCHLVN